MSKNLAGFPRSYIISLESAHEERYSISSSFLDHGYNRYRFVPGVDSRTAKNLLIGKTFNAGHTDKQSSETQLAVMMAHLNAIEFWLNDSTDEYAVIMEDDLSLEFVKHWAWSWESFFEKLPADFDIVQLCILKIDPLGYSKIRFEHRIRRSDYASAACYIISRRYAQELLRRHKVGNRFMLMPLSKGLNSVADEILYDTDKAYACPLFIFNDKKLNNRQSKSYVHDAAYDRMKYLWENHTPSNLESLFDNE